MGIRPIFDLNKLMMQFRTSDFDAITQNWSKAAAEAGYQLTLNEVDVWNKVQLDWGLFLPQWLVRLGVPTTSAQVSEQRILYAPTLYVAFRKWTIKAQASYPDPSSSQHCFTHISTNIDSPEEFYLSLTPRQSLGWLLPLRNCDLVRRFSSSAMNCDMLRYSDDFPNSRFREIASWIRPFEDEGLQLNRVFDLQAWNAPVVKSFLNQSNVRQQLLDLQSSPLTIVLDLSSRADPKRLVAYGRINSADISQVLVWFQNLLTNAFPG